MSSVQFVGGTIGTRKKKLTGTSVTEVVAAGGRQTVASINCAEIAGATPTITLEIYDGTDSFYITKGEMLSANRPKLYDQGWLLQPTESIRATASAANQIDVIVTLVERNLGAST